MDNWPEVTIDRVFTLEEIDQLSTSKNIVKIFNDLNFGSHDFENNDTCLNVLFQSIVVINYIVKNVKKRLEF